MSSRIISILAVAVLMAMSVCGCAAVKAHHRMLFGVRGAQAADPITGEWNFTGYDHGTALPAVFKLRLSGITITGSTYTEKTGEGTLREGKFESGKISFIIDFERHKSLIVEGVLRDGKLTGQCHHPDGPMYTWEAVPRTNDQISGEWNVTFYVHDMKTPATFTLKLDGTAVTGTAYSDHTGPGTIRDGKYAEGKLSFTLDFQKHESIVVNGVLKEGTLSGEFSTEGFTDKWEATKK